MLNQVKQYFTLGNIVIGLATFATGIGMAIREKEVFLEGFAAGKASTEEDEKKD